MKTISTSRRKLLENKGYRLFLLYVLFTVSGSSMCYIFLTWHVYAIANSFNNVIVNSICFWIPALLIGPQAGVIIDRYPRKSILMWQSLITAISFLLITPLLITNDKLMWCYTATLINGTSFAIANPTFCAFIRELVTDQKLIIANTTLEIAYELANIIGMGMAAILALILTAGQSLIITSTLTLVGAALLYTVKPHKLNSPLKHKQIRFWKNISKSICTLKNNRLLLTLSLIGVIYFTEFMIAPVLITPFIKTVLNGSTQLFSLIEIAMSAGIICGCFLIPTLSNLFGWVRSILMVTCTMIISLFIFGYNHNSTIAIILYFILGACFPAWSIIISKAQCLTPKTQQGRIQAITDTGSAVLIMLLHLGLFAANHWISVAHEYWLCASIGLVAVFLLFIIVTMQSRDHDFRQDDGGGWKN